MEIETKGQSFCEQTDLVYILLIIQLKFHTLYWILTSEEKDSLL